MKIPSFAELIGNNSQRKLIQETVVVSQYEGKKLPNILAIGNSGCGKTTLAKATAKLMKTEYYEFYARNIDKKIDEFVAEVQLLEDITIFIFIDEIHRLSTGGQEALFPILDSNKISIFGATTDTGKLVRPFQNRFKLIIHIEPYTYAQSCQITERFAARHKMIVTTEAKGIIANRGRGVPRTIESYVEGCYQKTQFRMIAGNNTSKKLIVSKEIALEFFNELQIDKKGLTKQERLILRTLYTSGVQSITTLCSICQIDQDQFSEFYEPFMMQLGFMEKTPRGRGITTQGKLHLINSEEV